MYGHEDCRGMFYDGLTTPRHHQMICVEHVSSSVGTRSVDESLDRMACRLLRAVNADTTFLKAGGNTNASLAKIVSVATAV